MSESQNDAKNAKNVGWTPRAPDSSNKITEGLANAVAELETSQLRNNSFEESNTFVTNNESRLILNTSSLHPKFEMMLEK